MLTYTQHTKKAKTTNDTHTHGNTPAPSQGDRVKMFCQAIPRLDVCFLMPCLAMGMFTHTYTLNKILRHKCVQIIHGNTHVGLMCIFALSMFGMFHATDRT